MVIRTIQYHITDIIYDLLNLIWPSLCASCGNRLFKNEDTVCTTCLTQLPRTNFHLWGENDFHQLFWGRVPVMYATAFFYFQKENQFRKLIHKLKYQKQPEIGIVLGRELGYEIKNSVLNEIDIIIPVPLHPKKQHIRGYNQSEMIATGLGQSMKKPVDRRSLVRNTHTATQTRKGRYERWENVKSIFTVKNPAAIQNRHILVVDDVVTTGSTLESCVAELLSQGAKAVSLATLGFAKN